MRPHRAALLRLACAGLLVAGLGAVPLVAQGCLEPIGSYDRGPVHDADITTDYAYVGSGYSLLVVDYVSDPERPVVVGDLVLSSFVYGVAVRGDVAYLATDSLVVVDISDPTAPKTLATVDDLDARHVAISDDLLIVTTDNGSPRFQIYDVSRPTSPKLLGGQSSGSPKSARIDGSRAFLSGGDIVRVVDLSQPEDPQILGILQSGAPLTALPHGNLVYVVDRFEDLLVFDFKNPGSPLLIGQLEMDSFNEFFDLVRLGDHLLLTSEDGPLYVVDISVPSKPELVRTLDLEGQGRFLAPLGPNLFAAQFNGGLAHLDTSQPEDPQPIHVLDTPGQIRGIQVQGDIAYLAAGFGGLKLVDLTDPTELDEISGYDTLGEAWDLQIVDQTVFVADGPRGLLTVDVSNLQIPRALDDIPSIGDARAVEVAGDFAYVAALFSGLQIVDVSFPLLIDQVGAFTAVDRAWDLELQGDVVFLADHNQGLRIVDVNQPDQPEQIALRDTPGQAISLSLQDTRVIVGNDFQPTTLYDVQDRSAPQLLGSYDCDAFDVLWRASTAFLNCRNVAPGQRSEIRAVSVARSGAVSHIATYNGVEGFTFLYLDGDHLYVGRGLGGVDLLDVSGCNDLLADGFESGDTAAWSAAVP